LKNIKNIAENKYTLVFFSDSDLNVWLAYQTNHTIVCYAFMSIFQGKSK